MSRDLVVGCCLAVLSVGYAALALLLPRHPVPEPGPAFLPLLLAAALLAVALAFVRSGWKARSWALTPGGSAALLRRRSVRVGALCAAYVPAFYVLGFLGSTAALAVLLARLFGERRWIVLLALGIAIPLGLLAVFDVGLGVSFPLRPPAF